MDLLRSGIKNPQKVPGFLIKRAKQKTGISPWGMRAPLIKAAEYRYKNTTYPHDTTSIWERDWDLLVILDACRPEWMRTVQHEFEFIPDVQTIHSVGSHSEEWISNTFTTEYENELSDTIYITGNHYAEGLDNSPLQEFVTAHDHGSWAYESASPPPHVITDLAVRTAHNADWDRCIVHYMQPHKPFFTRGEDRQSFSVKDWSLGYEPYHRHFNGELSIEDLHDAFTENLRYVLAEVDLLLNNIDAETAVLSSDHGQALGEDGLWDHTVGVKHPSMKCVPWVETTATDRETLRPEEFDAANYDDDVVKENLEALGYR